MSLRLVQKLTRYALGCSDFHLRGVKDTDGKILACYLAQRLTSCSDRQIALYFYIDKKYMANRIMELSVNLLVDLEMKKTLLEIEDLYKEIVKIKINNYD